MTQFKDVEYETITIVPSYGRDYSNADQAVKAFAEGKDFRIQDVSHEYDGSYCSVRDLDGYVVTLRYKLRELIVLVEVNDGLCSYVED